MTISNFFVPLFHPSQPQPEPCTAAVLAFISVFNASSEPKSAATCFPKAESAADRVDDEPVGARFLQNSWGEVVSSSSVSVSRGHGHVACSLPSDCCASHGQR